MRSFVITSPTSLDRTAGPRRPSSRTMSRSERMPSGTLPSAETISAPIRRAESSSVASATLVSGVTVKIAASSLPLSIWWTSIVSSSPTSRIRDSLRCGRPACQVARSPGAILADADERSFRSTRTLWNRVGGSAPEASAGRAIGEETGHRVAGRTLQRLGTIHSRASGMLCRQMKRAAPANRPSDDAISRATSGFVAALQCCETTDAGEQKPARGRKRYDFEVDRLDPEIGPVAVCAHAEHRTGVEARDGDELRAVVCHGHVEEPIGRHAACAVVVDNDIHIVVAIGMGQGHAREFDDPVAEVEHDHLVPVPTVDGGIVVAAPVIPVARPRADATLGAGHARNVGRRPAVKKSGGIVEVLVGRHRDRVVTVRITEAAVRPVSVFVKLYCRSTSRRG